MIRKDYKIQKIPKCWGTTTKFATKLLNHVLNATSDQAESTINIIPNIILSYTLLVFFYRF